ncbi:hypothetical protein F5Y14DRAFT_229472 [Nemania sp. NC0429]|nr:hypothetical protein F5Y14DRAFT_229472 [Nemania sp. NC0429]
MVQIRLFLISFLLSMRDTASAEPIDSDKCRLYRSRDTMDATSRGFYRDIGLSDDSIAQVEKASEQRTTISDTPGGLQMHLFCLTAQLSLGPGKVDVPPLNNTVVLENWSQTCIAEPGCIVQPHASSDVSKLMRMISFFNVKFAVRSGGHSPNPGWSSISSGGVLVDMQKMNRIDLSADKSVATVGPGARWGEVIAAISPQQVAVLGGRIPIVGVAGLLLGGGYSYLTGEFGTAADSVKNYEVVLGDGSIVHANSGHNSDLFWALKGGGPNFGIVTRFDLFTVPISDVWYEIILFTPDQAHAVLDAFSQWQQDEGFDTKSSVTLSIGLDIITVGLLYSTPTDRPSCFEPFYSLQPALTAVPSTNGTLAQVYEMAYAAVSTEPLRHDYRGASSLIDADLYKSVYSYWREKALAVRESTGANQTFAMQHVAANVAAYGRSQGGNPMGIPHCAHQWWTTLADWREAEHDELVRSVAIGTSEQWKKLGTKRGSYLPFLYMNDASRDQNPLATYGTENLDKLRAIARKYDLHQVFQRLQAGGFLLSKA